MGVAADLLQLLQLLPDSLQNTATAPTAVAAAGAAAGALRAFTTADDDRPPASKAFMHARLLAGQPHNALQVLLPVLQHMQQGPNRRVGPLMAVLAAVRQVRAVCVSMVGFMPAVGRLENAPCAVCGCQAKARYVPGMSACTQARPVRHGHCFNRSLSLHLQIAANDEICKSFAESGGVTCLHQLLSSATDDGPPELVRSAAAALRQLANSDGIKQQLAEAGVLGAIMR